jgi:RND family efflux transporter MFP subunit
LNTVELVADAVKRLGIEVATVEMREVRRERPYGAELVLPTGAAVTVSSPLMGTLKLPAGKKFPRVGQRVTANETMMELVPLLSPERAVLTPAERINLAQARMIVSQAQVDAEGQVKQAEVQVERDQIALGRAQRLLKDQVGTKRAVDEADAQLKLSEKALDAAMTRKRLVDAIKLDKLDDETGTVRPLAVPAPMAGIVRATQVQAGEMVAAGAPLFEIMNDEFLWVKVPVYVGDVDEIDPTQSVQLTTLDGRRTDSEIVVQPVELPPTAAPLAAAVDFYYELKNHKREFAPGQRLTAHVPLKGNGERRVIPWSAVYHDIHGGQWVYEQVDERKFVRRRVEVGSVSDGWAALERGPAPPAKIVIAGTAELAGTEFGFAK